MREVQDSSTLQRVKIDDLENNTPQIVRDMVNYYFDQRVETRLDVFITHEDLKKQLAKKMDLMHFRDFQRK